MKRRPPRELRFPDENIRALAPPIWHPPASNFRPVAKTPPHGSPALGTHDGAFSALPGRGPQLDDGRSDAADAVAGPNIPFELTRRASTAPPPPPPDPFDEPVTQRGPFGPLAVGASDPTEGALARIAPIFDQLRHARDRDSIMDLVVVALQTVDARVAVFAVKREALVGWACSPGFADRAALRAVRLHATGTVLGAAIGHDRAHIVRIPQDAAHAPLWAAMRAPPSTGVALAAVHVDGRAAAVLIATELLHRELALRRLDETARVAGEAITELLRARRR
jgi:hypothetical protein